MVMLEHITKNLESRGYDLSSEIKEKIESAEDMYNHYNEYSSDEIRDEFRSLYSFLNDNEYNDDLSDEDYNNLSQLAEALEEIFKIAKEEEIERESEELDDYHDWLHDETQRELDNEEFYDSLY